MFEIVRRVQFFELDNRNRRFGKVKTLQLLFKCRFPGESDDKGLIFQSRHRFRDGDILNCVKSSNRLKKRSYFQAVFDHGANFSNSLKAP